MFINGGCVKCDLSEPDNGYGPAECNSKCCGNYTPTPIEAGTFEELYKLIEDKTGKKMLFETIEEFNNYYGLNAVDYRMKGCELCANVKCLIKNTTLS